MLAVLIVSMFPACSFANGPVAFSPVIHDSQNQTGSPGSQPVAASSGIRSATQVNPKTAMWHSLALPGWGQFDNGRKGKAALMIAAELVCIGGIAYESHRLSSKDISDFEREVITTDRNTFIIYWMLAKVVGMMDAYVDAHLADYDISDIAPQELRSNGDLR